MSSRLNDSCQDAIEKFTSMADKGMKINDPQMSQWANQILSSKKVHEEFDSNQGNSGNNSLIEELIDTKQLFEEKDFYSEIEHKY